MDTGVVNTVRFTLPSLPGSLNVLYELNAPNSGLPRKRLKGEWALWVSRAIPFVPAFRIQTNSILRVDRKYFLPWFYKNGNWRKVDVVNLDALLFNLVTRKVGIDDMMIKQGFMDSVDSTENKVEIVMTEIPEATWRSVPLV